MSVVVGRLAEEIIDVKLAFYVYVSTDITKWRTWCLDVKVVRDTF